jgi:hypothetical protein
MYRNYQLLLKLWGCLLSAVICLGCSWLECWEITLLTSQHSKEQSNTVSLSLSFPPTMAKFFLYAGGLVGQQIIEKSHFISIEYTFLFMNLQQIRQVFLPVFHMHSFTMPLSPHTTLQGSIYLICQATSFETLKWSDFILRVTLVSFSRNTGSLIRIFSNHICWDHCINIFKSFIWLSPHILPFIWMKPTLMFLFKYWAFYNIMLLDDGRARPGCFVIQIAT